MLPGPIELLELNDGETLTFQVLEWQREETIIRPAHAPQGKAADTLRVHLPKDQKKFFPFYWDITSKRAIAQLMPHLGAPGFQRKTFRLTKFGEKPRAYFTLEVK